MLLLTIYLLGKVTFIIYENSLISRIVENQTRSIILRSYFDKFISEEPSQVSQRKQRLFCTSSRLLSIVRIIILNIPDSLFFPV